MLHPEMMYIIKGKYVLEDVALEPHMMLAAVRNVKL